MSTKTSPALHVLLAEQDHRLANMVTHGLHESGCTVDVVRDGRTAVRKARAGDYDVLVLSTAMSPLNGHDALKAIREHDAQTPILMLTVKNDTQDQLDAFELGADDYLTTPFHLAVFLARLRALARRAGTGADIVLRVGSLDLDTGAHRVSRRDTTIELTPREFELLKCLMFNGSSDLSVGEVFGVPVRG
ncbi:MAG: response regulator transcription factor [Actinomycetota bacterium]|nr:response regulator transcription factor [Actinomycetota bacterium]